MMLFYKVCKQRQNGGIKGVNLYNGLEKKLFPIFRWFFRLVSSGKLYVNMKYNQAKSILILQEH